ncbi:oxidoreductase [Adhaeribacter radiodurans]|uniref:Oxidoreductase n=1 Tax=Adhaeribacter radiodurans TaxID=2745197 RepID=A0A7L7L2U4_9BACT|nr:oxidoreductase [Adhaeribacter radiodurans]QMU26769.1 oxidoreductase [Adhaeribacter radiodurans]
MNSSQNAPITVGLASYGMSGMVFHAPLLATNPHFKLTKVLERSSEKSKSRYPEVAVVKDFQALIQDDSVELVVINTPNALHFEMGKQALRAGKHVVMEKPFTVTTQEANELINLSKEQNCILTVFQNRRWDGDFRTIHQVVTQKLLGKPVYYEAHYDRFRNYIEANTWKEETGPGSGLLYNLGSHMMDQALVLFGKPQAITAHLGTQRPGGKIDDYYDITLHYPELVASIKSSYLVREPGPRYILNGTEGSFHKYGIDPQEEALKAGQTLTSPNWGQEPVADWGKLNTQLNGLHFTGTIETLPGSYPAFYQNVYEAIRLGKELQVKPEEAALGIQLIELAQQSNAEKRTVLID